MSSTKKVVIIFTSIFVVSIIGIGITLGIFFGNGNHISNVNDIFGAGSYNVDESSNLDLNGITAIRVDCASAHINLVESNEPKAALKGTIISPFEQKNRLTVTKQGSTLNVKVEQNFFMFCLFCDVNLTVYLPKDSNLNASVYCSSGDIDITGLQFDNLVVSRSSGNFKIENCIAASLDSDASSGDTYITSSSLGSIDTLCHSGNTTISDTTGTMRVRATSGNIDIKGAEGSLDVGCTSGDVSIDMAGASIPPVTVDVTSGNMRFFVARDAAFDLAANVTSGDITSDINVTISGTLPHTFVGENVSGICNGGGEMVKLSATSGDISIIGK